MAVGRAYSRRGVSREEREDAFRVKMRAMPDPQQGGRRGSGWSRGWGWGGGKVGAARVGAVTRCGRSAGRVAAFSASDRQQRCTVKMAYHRASKAGAHVQYLQRENAGLEQEHSTADHHRVYLERDGGGLDHGRAQAYDLTTGEPVDAAEMVRGWTRDAYHWRGVMSPERVPESLGDMAREVFRGVESDLGTKLTGFYVMHHGDGVPHVHWVMRGRHENGRNLYIEPQYVKEGFRHRAGEYLTREFGERTDLEIAAGKERALEIQRERTLGRERVLELTQEHDLPEKDRLRLLHTMERGSPAEIERAHERLDAFERVQELRLERSLHREMVREHGDEEAAEKKVQKLERDALDGSEKKVRQVERQVEQVQQQAYQRQEMRRERTIERDMGMGL